MLKSVGQRLASLMVAAVVISGISVSPVCAMDSEPMMTEETILVEPEESEKQESEAGSAPASEAAETDNHSSSNTIYETRNGDTQTREIKTSNELLRDDRENVFFDIFDMEDLVTAFGADNVSVKSETEVVLLKDITFPEPDGYNFCFNEGNYLIDFNGHTCTGDMGFVLSGGSVTCIDTSADGNGGIIGKPGIIDEYIAISKYVFYLEGGTLTVASGRYSAFSTVIMAGTGNLTIEGGTLLALGQDEWKGFTPLDAYSGMQKTEILGGTFYGDWCAISCQNVAYDNSEKRLQNPLKIMGGVFDSDNRAIIYRDDLTIPLPDIQDLLAKDCIIVPSATEKYEYGNGVCTKEKVNVFKTTGVEGFVYRLYEKALGRTPDYQGYSNWVTQLQNKQKTGSEVAYGFFFSKELTNRKLTNEEFVTLLYNVFFDRAPDKGGLQNWLSALETGASRKYVFAGFANSQEWKGLCGTFGIEPGSYTSDEGRDQNLKVTAFVQRLYTLCLNRSADVAGLNNWTAALNNKSQDGAHVAYGFFFSSEFTNRKLSNADYVEVLYQVLLGRGSDPAGKADWVKQLDNGTERMDIFRGFVHSQEFDQICASYGIVRGTI